MRAVCNRTKLLVLHGGASGGQYAIVRKDSVRVELAELSAEDGESVALKGRQTSNVSN